MAPIKVFIADDHSLVRTGVISLLNDAPDIEVIGEAENGQEAVEKTLTLLPDVLIIDISMPVLSGIEAASIIKGKNPSINILVLTMHENEEYFYASLKKGASGIVHKNTSKEELILAIRTVASGKKYFGNSMSRLILDNMMHKFEEDQTANQKIILTRREKEVLHYIGEGLSNQEIAEALSISTRTVDTHKSNLMQKLNLKSSAALSRFAFENDYLFDNK